MLIRGTIEFCWRVRFDKGSRGLGSGFRVCGLGSRASGFSHRRGFIFGFFQGFICS